MPLYEIELPAELAELLDVEAARRGTEIGLLIAAILRDAVLRFEDAASGPAAAPPDRLPAATVQERTLARLFNRANLRAGALIGLGPLSLDWEKAKSTREEFDAVIASYLERGWLKRAGSQDVILTNPGHDALRRI